jgi:isoaspartyl peptidase/L-asparaginase-like protein (Ntn-hydrolase superfamily)
VAQAVLQTPHRLLVGEGATRFAHRAGFADVVPTCPEAVTKYQRRIRDLLNGQAVGGYDRFDWRRYWNYEDPPPGGESHPFSTKSINRSASNPTAGPSSLAESQADTGTTPGNPVPAPIGDTVGTVTRDAKGRFAATLSTGGTSMTLRGRVGDVPIYGCGLYAGEAGAVACTGFGEEIIRQAMARKVYFLMAKGLSARSAVQKACLLFGEEHSLGVIAVDQEGWGVAANRKMAFGVCGHSPPPPRGPDPAGSESH